MSERAIGTVLHLKERFLRSTDLKRDFGDASALEGYWLTDFGATCLRTVATGVRADSGRRAWRLTGDYGTGKSAFALLLATAMSDVARLPEPLKRKTLQAAPDIADAQYAPVLVIGSRQGIGGAILGALQTTLTQAYPRGGAAPLLDALKEATQRPVTDDDSVVDLVESAARHLAKSDKAKGLLIILDEVGKFLEYAANSGGSSDIFLLQRLSEAASRSKDAPVFLVCLLHQGFNAYADQLQPTAQREWAKIAGRFDEITFAQPIEERLALTQAALGVHIGRIPTNTKADACEVMTQAAKLRWFGGTASADGLVRHADGIFPIDAFTFPALGRMFQRFGQNERSLFSFIYSYEPFGLRDYSARPIQGCQPYRLHNLFDYARANFGHRLAVVSYRSRWTMIEAIIESFATTTELQAEVLKTVDILNLLDGDDLAPAAPVIEWAVGGADRAKRLSVRTCLADLCKRSVLYLRGAAKGYCLWPYTSVDLEKAYEEAKRAVGHACSVATYVEGQIDTRPIVARRHYIKTGNLRYFTVTYCPVNRLAETLSADVGDPDGEIIVALCETPQEHRQALKAAGEAPAMPHRIRLMGVPRPLERLQGIVSEALRWDWITTNVGALNSDAYARTEVDRHRTFAQEKVHAALQETVDANGSRAAAGLEWFHGGRRLNLEPGCSFVKILSDLCDDTYKDAPHLHNELLNRRWLSSAAASARMRLIEAMFEGHAQAFLGLPQERTPPEVSMYLSALMRTGIHRQSGDFWQLGIPEENDSCNMRPCMMRLKTIVESKPDERVSVKSIMDEMKRAPYGLREGVIPVLLAVLAITLQKDVAIYENGTFLREVGKDAFLRMTKAPQLFDIQYCRIEGVRAELFARLAASLDVPALGSRAPELMDIVQSVCTFVARLPEYSRNTRRVSKTCTAVRDAILSAREPIRLIFHGLPSACECPVIEPRKRVSPAQATELVDRLRRALLELGETFPKLQDRMRERISDAFGVPGLLRDARKTIAERGERVALGTTDPSLKAFCLRIMDDVLPEGDWLESVGSVLAKQPPSRWHDENEDAFAENLHLLVDKLKRVEAARLQDIPNHRGQALRVALTRPSGEERQEVVLLREQDSEALQAAEAEVDDVLRKIGRLGIAAASNVLWRRLGGKGE